LEILAERNYECILDFPEQQKKLDYWEQQRIKEEDDIR
jgi:hypothetical protein